MRLLQPVPEVNAPGSYLQCIVEPHPNRRECRTKAEEAAGVEFRAEWLWIALGPVLLVWLLVYIVVWTMRWVRRGFKPLT